MKKKLIPDLPVSIYVILFVHFLVIIAKQQKYNIKRKIDKISNKINFIQNNKKSIRSKKTNQIINLIKNNKQISHKELLGSKYLNWNSKTKFDGYRKALLRSRNIEEIAFNSNKRLSGNRKYEWRSIYKYTLD